MTLSLTICDTRCVGGRRESKGHADCSLQSLYMCALLSWDCKDDLDNLLILSHLLEILLKIHAITHAVNTACSRILSMVSQTTSCMSCVAQEKDSPTGLTSEFELQVRTNLAMHLQIVH